MPTYVQAARSNIWHWCSNCNNYPANAAVRETQPGNARPRNGELCNPCLGKEHNNDCRS